MSKNVLKLRNPIKINNDEVSELAYDGLEIPVDLYLSACAKAAAASADGGPAALNSKFQEVDYILHFYIGCAAVIACNRTIDFADLERIKGYDILELSKIGLFFIVKKLEEPSEESDSENSDETTPATSV